MSKVTRNQRHLISKSVIDFTDSIIRFHDVNTDEISTSDNTSRLGGVDAAKLRGEVETEVIKHVTTRTGAHKKPTPDQLNGVSIDDLNNTLFRALKLNAIPYCAVQYDSLGNPIGNTTSANGNFTTWVENNEVAPRGINILGQLDIWIHGNRYQFTNQRLEWDSRIKGISDQGFIAYGYFHDNGPLRFGFISDKFNDMEKLPQDNTLIYIATYDKTYGDILWTGNSGVHGYPSNRVLAKRTLGSYRSGTSCKDTIDRSDFLRTTSSQNKRYHV